MSSASASLLDLRRAARERALQVLFLLDARGFVDEVDDALAVFWASGFDPEAPVPDPDVVRMTERLVRGVNTKRTQVDEALQRQQQLHAARLAAASRGVRPDDKPKAPWKLERMSRVDRNILRLAAWELLFVPEIAAPIVLNEAIELAKKFGTEESGAFVNGLLDRLAQEIKA